VFVTSTSFFFGKIFKYFFKYVKIMMFLKTIFKLWQKDFLNGGI